MNILRFLTPKSQVVYLYSDFTLRQAMEKMEYHRYTAVPVINRSGEYVDILTEGDVLWSLKNTCNFDLRVAEQTPLSEVHRHSHKDPIGAGSDIEDLMSLAINQNFVPVIDDTNVFIGIVTRKDIMQYCFSKLNETK
ncbi:MAG: CBS domain-containing protein [Oscillospiraceae bacterium]|nr:CBS domain-containing protein [Oscillospiraceae bacterium]